jgi:hypothetical protein
MKARPWPRRSCGLGLGPECLVLALALRVMALVSRILALVLALRFLALALEFWPWLHHCKEEGKKKGQVTLVHTTYSMTSNEICNRPILTVYHQPQNWAWIASKSTTNCNCDVRLIIFLTLPCRCSEQIARCRQILVSRPMHDVACLSHFVIARP